METKQVPGEIEANVEITHDANASTPDTETTAPLEQENQSQEGPSIEEMRAQLDRLAASNDRLLAESRKHKAQKDKALQEKMLAEGRKDEVIQQQAAQLQEFEQQKESEIIGGALYQEARKRGYEDYFDSIIALGDPELVQYDPDSEQVLGAATFFDAFEASEKAKPYIAMKSRGSAETTTPSVEPMLDYKKDPLAYLKRIRKDRPDDYAKEVHRLQMEGIIK